MSTVAPGRRPIKEKSPSPNPLPAGAHDALDGWTDDLAEAILRRQRPPEAQPATDTPTGAGSSPLSSVRALFFVGAARFGQGSRCLKIARPPPPSLVLGSRRRKQPPTSVLYMAVRRGQVIAHRGLGRRLRSTEMSWTQRSAGGDGRADGR